MNFVFFAIYFNHHKAVSPVKALTEGQADQQTEKLTTVYPLMHACEGW